jgi:DNA ligase-associated metallophosphoesterase
MNAVSEVNGSSARAGLIGLAGAVALCDRRGGLYLPDLQMLVVSDLHLEKGSSAARRGRLLPPYDTAATLDLLEAVIDTYKPRTVLSLGDSFHDGGGAARMPAPYREKLLDLMRGRDWIWVTGNHDPDAPADLPGSIVDEVAIGRLRFRHEPLAGAEPGEVAGHLHPGATIVQRGRAVRRRCFATDGERLIMPAFGAFTGSLNVLDRAYRELFQWDSFFAHMLGQTRTYAIACHRLR